MKQRFLFITRNYPPQIGGLEAYSYNLINEFEKHHTVYKIVLTKSKIHLLWFLPFSLVWALFLTWQYRIGHVHLCDGVLAPLGLLLKFFCKARLSISIHGLDITFRNRLYQLLIPFCVAKLDQIVCVSQATLEECLQRKVPSHKCTIIPNGIHPDEIYLAQPVSELRAKLEEKINTSLQNKKVLVTVGRLVKRKGVAWFVSQVMPHLDSAYAYMVVGNGPEYKHIKALCASLNLGQRVVLLGEVTTEERNLVLNAADIFIMPNITVAGDMEGFGMVALEAGSCGLSIIASNIQGIKDAVIDSVSGYLVEEGNAEDFLKAITSVKLDREKIRHAVIQNYSWRKIFYRYQQAFLET